MAGTSTVVGATIFSKKTSQNNKRNAKRIRLKKLTTVYDFTTNCGTVVSFHWLNHAYQRLTKQEWMQKFINDFGDTDML
jgi:hypothetical protein